VGLLVDATARFGASAAGAGGAYRVYLTNDLTPAVLDDAVTRAANLIVTYHPTPFSAMKAFSMGKHASRVVLTCARNGIAVYSPHTALDAVVGGINDWLVDGVLAGVGGAAASAATRRPVRSTDADGKGDGGEASPIGEGRVVTLAACE
jgi:hypothetical protein